MVWQAEICCPNRHNLLHRFCGYRFVNGNCHLTHVEKPKRSRDRATRKRDVRCRTGILAFTSSCRRRGFLGFVQLMHPEWKIPKYQRDFIELLDKLERRELLNKKGEPVYNLLVNMPPRHNKSTLATKLFQRTASAALLVKDLGIQCGKRPSRIFRRGNSRLS